MANKDVLKEKARNNMETCLKKKKKQRVNIVEIAIET